MQSTDSMLCVTDSVHVKLCGSYLASLKLCGCSLAAVSSTGVAGSAAKLWQCHAFNSQVHMHKCTSSELQMESNDDQLCQCQYQIMQI